MLVMELEHGNDFVVADTASDSSISPDKKRKKLLNSQTFRRDKGKTPISFRPASRINIFDVTPVKSTGYNKKYPNTNVKYSEPVTVRNECIVVDDDNGGELVSKANSIGCPSQITRSKVLSLNTRTTLASFHDSLLKLNAAQQDAIRDTGFGYLLDLTVKELPGRLAYWAPKSFNPKTCELEISSNFRLKVTVDDVYRVFGLPKGVQRIKRFDRQTNHALFDEWFSLFGVGNRDKIKIGLVLNEMVRCKNGGTWFKRHFMIAMCFSLFESFSNGTVHPHILYTLFDVDNLDKWDWAEYMLRSLVENRDTWNGNESKMYIGPSLFLVLFYVDRINISGAITKRVFPVLLNWSSYDLRECQRIEMK
ncbi:uncharacterized protein LOC131020520 [Salvia miltiorrhiza]|uniref:uncharacterized protein LOC131020520 n=1 Tax=Salvia miltiorrhiza TaxID=226208 RepID=UPI0025AD9819|nr:uncharacterized protein LOC131020520 [Salvia miltiorrhiza]XP_057805374.1 uncharacterized protein LOC131020520 [Salvia miltiorrhiza]